MGLLIRRHRKKPVREEPVSEVEETEEQAFPKHTGGGWYELSNGEKVQGKEEAEKAEQERE